MEQIVNQIRLCGSMAFVLAYAEMFTLAKQIAAAKTTFMPLFVAGVFYFVFNGIVAYAMGKWFDENVSPDWISCRQKMMSLLQDEAELDEIVKMVGMDALSAGDRLKMEAARSIREDFLHQNSFHEIDTYTSLKKQLLMTHLVLAYYEQCQEALSKGADIQKLVKLAVRERIGRYKYTHEDRLDAEYDSVMTDLSHEIAAACGKEDF